MRVDTLKCIRTRREIRDYLDKPIPQEAIDEILEAGRLSPSSKNSQPWHFVITDKATLSRISTLTPTGKHISTAPMAIAIVMEDAKLPEIDGARAGQSMILTAWALGIGSCWITNFYEDGVKELLNVPQRMKLVTVLPFGYPGDRRTTRRKVRRPIGEIVHYERFGTSNRLRS